MMGGDMDDFISSGGIEKCNLENEIKLLKAKIIELENKNRISIRMKKLEWEASEDDLDIIVCDLAFIVWQINIYTAEIRLNGKRWHQHDTVKGAKIMIENRMREHISSLVEVINEN